jgi:hypothetical protein
MTKVLINPGACGMSATVEVEKKDGKVFAVTIKSECKMVSELGETLTELTMMDAFKRLLDNPVYRKGAACLRHVACPVPSGILKALEVEAGLNVPKEVSITFVTDDVEVK